jgi:hypothetical protein
VNQEISILASENDPRVLAELTDDTKPLGFYGLTDWQVLKVSSRLYFVFVDPSWFVVLFVPLIEERR